MQANTTITPEILKDFKLKLSKKLTEESKQEVTGYGEDNKGTFNTNYFSLDQMAEIFGSVDFLFGGLKSDKKLTVYDIGFGSNPNAGKVAQLKKINDGNVDVYGCDPACDDSLKSSEFFKGNIKEHMLLESFPKKIDILTIFGCKLSPNDIKKSVNDLLDGKIIDKDTTLHIGLEYDGQICGKYRGIINELRKLFSQCKVSKSDNGLLYLEFSGLDPLKKQNVNVVNEDILTLVEKEWDDFLIKYLENIRLLISQKYKVLENTAKAFADRILEVTSSVKLFNRYIQTEGADPKIVSLIDKFFNENEGFANFYSALKDLECGVKGFNNFSDMLKQFKQDKSFYKTITEGFNLKALSKLFFAGFVSGSVVSDYFADKLNESRSIDKGFSKTVADSAIGLGSLMLTDKKNPVIPSVIAYSIGVCAGNWVKNVLSSSGADVQSNNANIGK